MDQSTISNIVMIGDLIIFNIATLRILTYGLSNIDVKSALSEKSVQDGGAGQPGMALNVADPNLTSYSRLAGFLGASVMATFFWALGNVVIFKSFTSMQEIHSLLTSLIPYFLSGSSLFLPYAFNQIKSVFG